MNIKEIAESISKHNFQNAYEYFSEDIVWNLIGGNIISGKEDVIKTCKESAEYLASVKTTFNSFQTYEAENIIIIESSADYIDENNEKSVVSSCDIYKFAENKLIEITSYNIETT